MAYLKRYCILTRNFYSLQEPTLNNILTFQVPRSCYFLSLRFKSIDNISSSSERNEAAEVERNSNDERKIKYIQLELSSLHEQGKQVPNPDLIKTKHWDELLNLTTKSARQRYYKHLFNLQAHIENKKTQQQQKQKIRESIEALEPKQKDAHNTYKLGKKTFLLRINDSALSIWRNNRLRQAIQFGQKLIFDCSYDQHMTIREKKNTAKQLMYCFAENRKSTEPFDLHFCNVNFSGDTMVQLQKFIPTMRNIEFPLNLYEGSYLDLFPKQQLVYLTPHCRNDLKEYDPEAIYIIGAMVDKGSEEHLSLAKAKELNITMARLPLDKYLDWHLSSKSLTLDQMIKIMLDLKNTRNWEEALKHVPRRKVLDNFGSKPFYNETFINKRRNNERFVENKMPITLFKRTDGNMSTADKFKTFKSGNDNLPTADKFKTGSWKKFIK